MPLKDKKKPASESGKIVVTAQQSRFHVDASDAPNSKEIDIKDITITVGGRDLLSHADLTLRENKHYVLVGRNGTGKSTLFRAIADGLIPGIPWSLKILLLGQTDFVNNSLSSLDEDLANLNLEERTVLEHVLRSDASRERALIEAKHLSEALENSKDPLAIVQEYRRLKHAHVKFKYDEMSKIAARRSGARGAKARKDLLASEAELAEAQALLDQPRNEITPVSIQEETKAAVDMLTDIQTSLDAMDSASAEARARMVLLGLGFSEEAVKRPFKTLSGGWRTRCSLACALFQRVDILLLDECTNFLDLPAIIWLQGYVQSLDDTTIVVITHDRDFADAVADDLIVLREQKLEYFKGNLSVYEHERRSRTKYLTRMQEAQDKKTKHIESSISSALSAAKRTGDDKKLKQVASRRKKLEERTGLEVGLKGGRFKLNRDLAGYHLTNRAEIDIPKEDPTVKIKIPDEPTDLRFPGALVSLEKVSYTYPKTRTATLTDIDLVLHPGERVGLAGLNGSGKSTLVGLVVGVENVGVDGTGAGLKPSKGTVTRHTRAKIQCFSQHAVEALEKKGAANPELTSLQEMMDVTGGSWTEQECRGLLNGVGLPGRIASDVPVVALSGGQKARLFMFLVSNPKNNMLDFQVRLALARLVWTPPHLLVLDEVTTHLDFDTVVALVDALRQYQGALLVVTHDRFFMRCVVEGESPDDVLGEGVDASDEEEEEEEQGWQAKPGVVHRIVKGQLKKLEGGMRKYEQIAEKASAKLRILR